MKIKEFNHLTFKEKIRKVVSKSTYITSRIENGYIINLYHIYDFFVEEFYDCKENKVIRLKAYLTEKLMSRSNLYDLA